MTGTVYDVIIVGASFAGLAVANQLRDRKVLLLDRKPVGSGQTSACGTFLSVLQHWDVMPALLQVHDRLVLHTAHEVIEFASPYPWCTFDYRRLCEMLFERSGAEFLKVRVMGRQDGQVLTANGTFKARCVVDASGWHSILASPIFTKSEKMPAMSFGLEAICPIGGTAVTSPLADGLHFWYDRSVMPRGVGWAFPRGKEISIGLGAYGRVQPLRKPLEGFVRQLDLQPARPHGACLPFRLRSPIAGSVFLVGDAAGMCLGLTGEGIRPALFYGEMCGKILHRVLEGNLTLTQGLARYAAFVREKKRFFDILSSSQEVLTRLAPAWIGRLAHLIVRKRLRKWLFRRYAELTSE